MSARGARPRGGSGLRAATTVGMLALGLFGGDSAWPAPKPSAAHRQATASPPPTALPPSQDPGAQGPEVVMVGAGGEGARWWPRWRGPSGQGVAAGAGYPDIWSRQENLLWRVEIPGLDYSSPIVWGDWIFLTTSYEEDRRRSLIGLRRADGKLVWETFAPGSLAGSSARKIDYSIATPVTDGQRVYAFLGNQGVIAVTLDGNPVWHKNVGPFDHATSSPLLFDGLLIVVQVNSAADGSIVTALDADTGNTVWKRERVEHLASGTPIAVRVGEAVELLVNGQQQMQAYDPYTGAELWKARGNFDQVIPTPVVGGGLVYSVSGPAGPVFAVRPGGQGLVSDTHVVWRQKQWGPYVPSPLFWERYLYVLNDMSGVVTLFEASTGVVVRQEKLGHARREGFVASPVIADGKLFFTNVIGETYVLSPGPEGKLLRKNVLADTIRASPAAVEGRWYFRTAKHLLAIGH